MQNDRNTPDFPVTASPFDFRTEFDLSKLENLREAKGFSRQKLSEKSGVEYSALSRFLNGDTKNPSFTNVVSIIRALDGSVDEFVGIKPSTPEPSAAPPAQPQNVDFYERVFADMRLQFDTQISRLEEKHRLRISDLEKSRNRTFVLLVIVSVTLFSLLLFTIGTLIYDISNPNQGWIQMWAALRGLSAQIRDIFSV